MASIAASILAARTAVCAALTLKLATRKIKGGQRKHLEVTERTKGVRKATREEMTYK